MMELLLHSLEAGRSGAASLPIHFSSSSTFASEAILVYLCNPNA